LQGALLGLVLGGGIARLVHNIALFDDLFLKRLDLVIE